MTGGRRGRRLAWGAWATICVVWGTTYFAIKIALETIPPFVMGGLRFVTAGVLLAGLAACYGHRVPAPREWGQLAVLGFFMLLVGNGGVVWGEQYLPSGLTALLIGTGPFWMTGIDALMRGGRQLFLWQWTGLAVGFSGLALLVWPDVVAGGRDSHGFVVGVVSLQVACAGWAIGSAYIRRRVVPGDAFGSAAVQMVAGGLLMLAVGTGLGEWSRLSFNATTTLALLYLIVVGSIIGFAAYSYALQRLEVAVVSLYPYVNPVIAVALGTVVLGEPFHLRLLAGAAVIVVGALLVGRPGEAR